MKNLKSNIPTDLLIKFKTFLINNKIIKNIKNEDFLHHFSGKNLDLFYDKIIYIKKINSKPNKSYLYSIVLFILKKDELNKDDFRKIFHSFLDENNNNIKIKYHNNHFYFFEFKNNKFIRTRSLYNETRPD